MITQQRGWNLLSKVRAHLGTCRRHGIDTAILVVSLVASAYLMAYAAGPAHHPWLGWYALLPLFVAIRVCRPATALAAGALWGICLYLFSALRFNPDLAPGIAPFLLLAAAPAVYACFGAWLTRWVGFSPFVLGVGWVAVEVALTPVGLTKGLLGETYVDGSIAQWLGSALGYVHVALIVGIVNACLVAILSRVRIASAQPRPVLTSRDRGALLLPQISSCVSLLFIRATRPRAPPPAFSLA